MSNLLTMSSLLIEIPEHVDMVIVMFVVAAAIISKDIKNTMNVMLKVVKVLEIITAIANM